MRQVVGATIIDRQLGRILLVQRVGNKSFPYLWECAGGKVEEGETLLETCVREIREEIGLTITVKEKPLWQGELTWKVDSRAPKDRPLHYTMFEADAWSGTLGLREGQAGMGWFNWDQYQHMLTAGGFLMPANTAAGTEIVGRLLDCVTKEQVKFSDLKSGEGYKHEKQSYRKLP